MKNDTGYDEVKRRRKDLDRKEAEHLEQERLKAVDNSK